MLLITNLQTFNHDITPHHMMLSASSIRSSMHALCCFRQGINYASSFGMTTSFFYPYTSGSNGTEAVCNHDVLATIQLGQEVQAEGRATAVSPPNNETALMQVSAFLYGGICNQRFVTAAVVPLSTSGHCAGTHPSLSVTLPPAVTPGSPTRTCGGLF